jgi:hypothetical protein
MQAELQHSQTALQKRYKKTKLQLVHARMMLHNYDAAQNADHDLLDSARAPGIVLSDNGALYYPEQ